MIKLKIKPLSVNEAWQGRRFKTNKYKAFEKEVLFLLPNIDIPPQKWEINYEVGYSYLLSDIDNFLKPFQDCLQKRYGINDRDIYRITIDKRIVKKGEEFIGFKISHLNI